MSCELADRDGAYVLGSLSPTERKEFEQHLAGCKECARNVRQLAGLPGLLARVDRAVLEDPVVRRGRRARSSCPDPHLLERQPQRPQRVVRPRLDRALRHAEPRRGLRHRPAAVVALEQDRAVLR